MVSQGSLTITLSGSRASRPETLRTRTKADGRFRFGDLKPGTYRLYASHQGGLYCPAEYGQKDWKEPGLDVVVTAGENVRNANIEMTPPGTISGRVVDENGNPAGRVRVMAIDASWKYGKLSLGIVQALYTDDHGGDTDPRNARAVDLAPGVDVSGIDISLNGSRSPARRIRGVVLDAAGRPVNKGSISAIPLIDKATMVMPEAQTGADGSFELTTSALSIGKIAKG